MSARREVEFPWVDGTTVLSRPTLLKISQVETAFGPAMRLLERIGQPEMSTTKEFLPLLTIILRGCDEVPKSDKQIQETAFDLGLAQFTLPVVNWIVAAYTVDNPAEAGEGDKPGN